MGSLAQTLKQTAPQGQYDSSCFARGLVMVLCGVIGFLATRYGTSLSPEMQTAVAGVVSFAVDQLLEWYSGPPAKGAKS